MSGILSLLLLVGSIASVAGTICDSSQTKIGREEEENSYYSHPLLIKDPRLGHTNFLNWCHAATVPVIDIFSLHLLFTVAGSSEK